jgi:hypothetical protein
LKRRALNDMTPPEAYNYRERDERYGGEDTKMMNGQRQGHDIDLVNSVSEDLVNRIDRFLNEETSSSDSKIREGTKEKVRESLNVIQEAINRYQ